VLTEHLVDEPGHPTRDALRQVLDPFRARPLARGRCGAGGRSALQVALKLQVCAAELVEGVGVRLGPQAAVGGLQ
jgi:hypothetical protein